MNRCCKETISCVQTAGATIYNKTAILCQMMGGAV